MSADQFYDLKQNAKDMNKTPFARIPRKLSRVCFIVVNTTLSYREGNGVAPVNRAVPIAQAFKQYGYDVYFLANSHTPLFVEYLKLFIGRTYQHFVFVVCGQGGEGGPETLVFDDMPMSDEEFIALVNGYRVPNVPLTLIGEFSGETSIFANPSAYTDGATSFTVTGDYAKYHAGADSFVRQFTAAITDRHDMTGQKFYDLLRVLMKRQGLNLIVKASPEIDLEKPIAIWEPRQEMNQLIV